MQNSSVAFIIYSVNRVKSKVSDLNQNEKQKKRFSELSDRAEIQRRTVFSDFLNLDEQNVLNSAYYSMPVQLLGGYETAERKIACFGRDDAEVLQAKLPISCIKISPAAPKFADKLTHRDFLGALMNLGIKREMLGDIIVYENTGYLFCLNKIADYIIDNVSTVKHTTVKCTEVPSPPVESVALPDEETITVASERIDVLIASVFKLSRSAVVPMFVQGKVFISGRQISNSSHQLNNGDIVSVRGCGRFIYCGTFGKTKKDRLKVTVRVFR